MIAALIISLTSATPAVAQDEIVRQWNDALLQTVRTVPFLVTARALAILHTSMYDAWVAYDPVAVGTASAATFGGPSLIDLFPAEKTARLDPLISSLGYDPGDTTLDSSTPAGIGNVAAERFWPSATRMAPTRSAI